MSQPLPAFFASLPGFSRLAPADVAGIAAACEEKTFERGTLLFAEDSPGGEMFILKTGAVQVIKHFRGKDQILATLLPGDILGDMSLIDGRPHSADCKASQNTQAVVLPRPAYEQLMRDRPGVAILIMEYLAHTLCDRIRRANRTLALFHLAD